MELGILTARQVAFAICKRFPWIDKEEAVAESMVIMLDAIDTWNPDKGRNIRSWIAFKCHRELKKIFLQSETSVVVYTDSLIEIEESLLNEVDPETMIVGRDKFAELSETSKDIIRMVFSGKLSKNGNKNSIKQEIKAKLRKNGVAFNKIQTAFHELKQAVG